MDWIYLLDLFGTCVFAISGVLTAKEKKFDLVGSLIIGFTTAIGGGTIRDLLIGRSPVGWLVDHNYISAIFVGYLISYLFTRVVLKLKKSMFFFDTLGIGLFTILGIQIALQQDLNVISVLILGVISACFGGVIRDVLCNDVPLIFRREIYATACFLGGIIYFGLHEICPVEPLNIALSIGSVIIIRYLAIRLHWSLNFFADHKLD